MTQAGETYLRDVIDMPSSVHAGDFKVELTGGFTETEARVAEYVVTDQLRAAFGTALSIVRAAVRDQRSHAAYLHGSFGSGKSHFLTVLHAILNNDPAAREKRGLQPVIAEHDEWLAGKRFLMVPYHLIGASDIDSAILGGYVAAVRAKHPDRPTPPVYRADAMLDDARTQRAFLADDARFAEWLGAGATAPSDPEDLEPLEGAGGHAFSPAELDRAFAAPPGDPTRDALVSALLDGPMSSYARGARGDAEAFIPLENGLSVITRHARDLGYDGLVLFLDELILWLQAHMSDQSFVNEQVGKLVKLIESGAADRALPVVSFISRQRDLSQLVGEDVAGSDVKNLEAQVQYLSQRFDVVPLEDRNLPAIVSERVLKPKPGAAAQIDAAFAQVESSKQAEKETMLDPEGATGASWDDFRAVYPLTPALLNVLVELSGALQRERTGLKLLQEMLHRRRDDMLLGELIPLGDLWDVLSGGTSEAFTDRLAEESETAARFYRKARGYLETKRSGADDAAFRADDRVVKTLLLAALTPNVPALRRLTGPRLAALNHGSIRSRTVAPGKVVTQRLQEMRAEFGELRSDDAENSTFWLVLSDLDVEPLLEAVGEQDSLGARRVWCKGALWDQLGIADGGEFVSEHEIAWRGTPGTAEFLFGNVRDSHELPDAQFAPAVPGRIRFVLDYPFDKPDYSPAFDSARVNQLRREGTDEPTLVWLPHHFSAQKSAQLGRLLKIGYLLERDRLDDYASTYSADNRLKLRHQLQAQRDNLESQLSAALAQLYGIERPDEATVGARVGEDGHVLSLRSGHAPPRPLAGAGFRANMLAFADDMFAALYPHHPDFDPNETRKPITTRELRTVLGWITQAMDDPARRVVVDRKDLPLVRRVVHPLELGQVSDGPLNVSTEWRRRIEAAAAAHGVTGDYPVEDIRGWITGELGYGGLDKPVANLVISAYALLADRAWLLHGSPLPEPPELERIGPGHALRAQELPSAEEFAAARHRAAAVFGLHVPELLVARTVARLAAQVRDKVTEREPAVDAVRRRLGEHAADLGVEPSAARLTTAREAAQVLAKLGEAGGDTALVRALAGAEPAASDEVLGKAIASAPAVEQALRELDWSLLESVRGFTDRDGGTGERARALLDELGETAATEEFTTALAPALASARSRALELVTEAARQAPAQQQAAEARSEPEPQPPLAAASSPATTRVPASRVEQVLDTFLSEILGYAEAHPAAEIEVTWRVVGEDSS
jgi:hypothetical protein